MQDQEPVRYGYPTETAKTITPPPGTAPTSEETVPAPARGSAPGADAERTPEWLVGEVRRELRKIDDEFNYRDGIESAVSKHDAVLDLMVWAVGRLARMIPDGEGKAQNKQIAESERVPDERK